MEHKEKKRLEKDYEKNSKEFFDSLGIKKDGEKRSKKNRKKKYKFS